MGFPKGTKLTDNPKDKRIGIRLTEGQQKKLNECSEKLNISRTEVIIKGIDKVHEEIK